MATPRQKPIAVVPNDDAADSYQGEQ